MIQSKPPKLKTVGVIAQDLGVPIHRIAYILSHRPHIRPLAVAGRVRLYDREAVAQVRHELTAIGAKRSSNAGGSQAI